jgi:hypothetical protein
MSVEIADIDRVIIRVRDLAIANPARPASGTPLDVTLWLAMLEVRRAVAIARGETGAERPNERLLAGLLIQQDRDRLELDEAQRLLAGVHASLRDRSGTDDLLVAIAEFTRKYAPSKEPAVASAPVVPGSAA